MGSLLLRVVCPSVAYRRRQKIATFNTTQLIAATMSTRRTELVSLGLDGGGCCRSRELEFSDRDDDDVFARFLFSSSSFWPSSFGELSNVTVSTRDWFLFSSSVVAVLPSTDGNNTLFEVLVSSSQTDGAVSTGGGAIVGTSICSTRRGGGIGAGTSLLLAIETIFEEESTVIVSMVSALPVVVSIVTVAGVVLFVVGGWG